jgi:hypothetical protein
MLDQNDRLKLEAARRLAVFILAEPGRYPELVNEATSIVGPAVTAWLQNAPSENDYLPRIKTDDRSTAKP